MRPNSILFQIAFLIFAALVLTNVIVFDIGRTQTAPIGCRPHCRAKTFCAWTRRPRTFWL